MLTTHFPEVELGLLATILSDDAFWPTAPQTVEESGVPVSFIESLICKNVLIHGTLSGRNVADHLCLPFGMLEEVLSSLRTRQVLVHAGPAPFNDYYYGLTEKGAAQARVAMDTCAYVGPAPVPLMDYVISVDAQSISAEAPRRQDLEAAVADISVSEDLFDLLGPAVNSGAGMFLFGAPGNGKSTLARRITDCFGQQIWIPSTIIDGDQVIKLYDPSYQHMVDTSSEGLLNAQSHDRRWIRIKRPTVVIGGELTLDNLEIRHDTRSNICEAPLQLKSNCGCLLIDDFGRQRVAPADLLNRWIIPLENRHDFLALPSGKKIQVPFEQLIIFSTNLEPCELVDEAFLRRIPYKIEVGDPSEEEFHHLFQLCCYHFGCDYRADVVEDLLECHYRTVGRALRRCHPRDLLSQVRNMCTYRDVEFSMKPEYFDRVVASYFAMVLGESA